MKDFESSIDWSTLSNRAYQQQNTVKLQIKISPAFMFSQLTEEEISILKRLLRCADMEWTDKKVRINAVWKIIFQEFRDFVCQTAETKLEQLIGKNNFFNEKACNLKSADGQVTHVPTHPDELFKSKTTTKSLMLGQGYAFLKLMNIPDYLHSAETAHQIYLLLCHKKVTRCENKISSVFTAFMKGKISKIKKSFYSRFFNSHRKYRRGFFKEPLIKVLWSRFCTSK